ncbi:MAG: hypothetical protein HPM95_21055 [Alphaproteobacteria bacterium]|nr:hypothetical protein [Alphaproteobacteria bacterium]
MRVARRSKTLAAPVSRINNAAVWDRGLRNSRILQLFDLGGQRAAILRPSASIEIGLPGDHLVQFVDH